MFRLDCMPLSFNIITNLMLSNSSTVYSMHYWHPLVYEKKRASPYVHISCFQHTSHYFLSNGLVM